MKGYEKTPDNKKNSGSSPEAHISHHPRLNFPQHSNDNKPLKYPKSVISEKNEMIDINDICMKTKEKYYFPGNSAMPNQQKKLTKPMTAIINIKSNQNSNRPRTCPETRLNNLSTGNSNFGFQTEQEVKTNKMDEKCTPTNSSGNENGGNSCILSSVKMPLETDLKSAESEQSSIKSFESSEIKTGTAIDPITMIQELQRMLKQCRAQQFLGSNGISNITKGNGGMCVQRDNLVSPFTENIDILPNEHIKNLNSKNPDIFCQRNSLTKTCIDDKMAPTTLFKPINQLCTKHSGDIISKLDVNWPSMSPERKVKWKEVKRQMKNVMLVKKTEAKKEQNGTLDLKRSEQKPVDETNVSASEFKHVLQMDKCREINNRNKERIKVLSNKIENKFDNLTPKNILAIDYSKYALVSIVKKTCPSDYDVKRGLGWSLPLILLRAENKTAIYEHISSEKTINEVLPRNPILELNFKFPIEQIVSGLVLNPEKRQNSNDNNKSKKAEENRTEIDSSGDSISKRILLSRFNNKQESLLFKLDDKSEDESKICRDSSRPRTSPTPQRPTVKKEKPPMKREKEKQKPKNPVILPPRQGTEREKKLLTKSKSESILTKDEITHLKENNDTLLKQDKGSNAKRINNILMYFSLEKTRSNKKLDFVVPSFNDNQMIQETDQKSTTKEIDQPISIDIKASAELHVNIARNENSFSEKVTADTLGSSNFIDNRMMLQDCKNFCEKSNLKESLKPNTTRNENSSLESVMTLDSTRFIDNPEVCKNSDDKTYIDKPVKQTNWDQSSSISQHKVLIKAPTEFYTNKKLNEKSVLETTRISNCDMILPFSDRESAVNSNIESKNWDATIPQIIENTPKDTVRINDITFEVKPPKDSNRNSSSNNAKTPNSESIIFIGNQTLKENYKTEELPATDHVKIKNWDISQSNIVEDIPKDKIRQNKISDEAIQRQIFITEFMKDPASIIRKLEICFRCSSGDNRNCDNDSPTDSKFFKNGNFKVVDVNPVESHVKQTETDNSYKQLITSSENEDNQLVKNDRNEIKETEPNNRREKSYYQQFVQNLNSSSNNESNLKMAGTQVDELKQAKNNFYGIYSDPKYIDVNKFGFLTNNEKLKIMPKKNCRRGENAIKLTYGQSDIKPDDNSINLNFGGKRLVFDCSKRAFSQKIEPSRIQHKEKNKKIELENSLQQDETSNLMRTGKSKLRHYKLPHLKFESILPENTKTVKRVKAKTVNKKKSLKLSSSKVLHTKYKRKLFKTNSYEKSNESEKIKKTTTFSKNNNDPFKQKIDQNIFQLYPSKKENKIVTNLYKNECYTPLQQKTENKKQPRTRFRLLEMNTPKDQNKQCVKSAKQSIRPKTTNEACCRDITTQNVNLSNNPNLPFRKINPPNVGKPTRPKTIESTRNKIKMNNNDASCKKLEKLNIEKKINKDILSNKDLSLLRTNNRIFEKRQKKIMEGVRFSYDKKPQITLNEMKKWKFDGLIENGDTGEQQNTTHNIAVKKNRLTDVSEKEICPDCFPKQKKKKKDENDRGKQNGDSKGKPKTVVLKLDETRTNQQNLLPQISRGENSTCQTDNVKVKSPKNQNIVVNLILPQPNETTVASHEITTQSRKTNSAFKDTTGLFKANQNVSKQNDKKLILNLILPKQKSTENTIKTNGVSISKSEENLLEKLACNSQQGNKNEIVETPHDQPDRLLTNLDNNPTGKINELRQIINRFKQFNSPQLSHLKRHNDVSKIRTEAKIVPKFPQNLDYSENACLYKQGLNRSLKVLSPRKCTKEIFSKQINTCICSAQDLHKHKNENYSNINNNDHSLKAKIVQIEKNHRKEETDKIKKFNKKLWYITINKNSPNKELFNNLTCFPFADEGRKPVNKQTKPLKSSNKKIEESIINYRNEGLNTHCISSQIKHSCSHNSHLTTLDLMNKKIKTSMLNSKRNEMVQETEKPCTTKDVKLTNDAIKCRFEELKKMWQNFVVTELKNNHINQKPVESVFKPTKESKEQKIIWTSDSECLPSNYNVKSFIDSLNTLVKQKPKKEIKGKSKIDFWNDKPSMK